MPGQPRIQLLGAGLEHRGKRGLDQVGLVPEMVIEVGLRHADQLGDVPHRHGLIAALREQAGGCVEQLGSHIGHQKSRSEEHTSELQSLMRISYAVFCLKKKNKYTNYNKDV